MLMPFAVLFIVFQLCGFNGVLECVRPRLGPNVCRRTGSLLCCSNFYRCIAIRKSSCQDHEVRMMLSMLSTYLLRLLAHEFAHILVGRPMG